MKKEINNIISDHNVLVSNLIHSIDKQIFNIFNKELSVFGLTFQQALAVLFIAKHSDSYVYQKDIEIYTGLTNPSVTSIMRNLINNGFVYRIKDENDGRYFHLHLTEKSLAIQDDLVDIINNTNIFIASFLERDEAENFVRQLELINQSLSEYSGHLPKAEHNSDDK